MRRCLQTQLKADLGEEMVLLGGPWRVGKTTLAREDVDSPAMRATAERHVV
jgi:tRNA A37 threonylcarbamoyladenosine biosynthesis protein TsaE